MEFLHQSSKKFDILFLLHSKQEFLKIMEEKGKEMEKLSYDKNQNRKNLSFHAVQFSDRI